MRWKWQGAKGGSTRDGGNKQDQDKGVLQHTSACGKPSIARKPEDYPKIFKW